MSDDSDHGWTTRRVRQALEEGQDAVTEYHYLRQSAAAMGRNPNQDSEVLAQWARMHAYTMRAYKRLRPHIKAELSPEYWHNATVYKDAEIVIVGLKTLERLQDRVMRDTKLKPKKHKDDERVEEWTVDLLPPRFYDRTLNLLSDAARQLDIIEQRNSIKNVHDLGDPGDEELPEGIPGSETDASEPEATAATDGGQEVTGS